MMGSGMDIITKSLSKSVTQNTVSISNELVHCVKKSVIGAQFQLQWVPHWNTVAKKNEMLHAMTKTIVAQQTTLNEPT